MSLLTFRRASIAALIVPSVVIAQRGPGGGAAAAPPADPATLTWRNIGPNQAGRMVAVAGSAARPNEYFLGTTGGGVWKTSDGGVTAVPVTDDYFGGTIGAISVAESNPDIVYVGGGETPIRGDVSHGDGLWKSTDAGKTWTYMGLREAQYISRIRIDPRNPDILYVGALGHVFGPNKERGVYKSIDGGKSFKQVLFRNDSTGIIELVMDPSNANTLYAAFWQAGRKPWLLVSGGAGSGIFKTTDGGDHWTEITRNPGLPAGLIGNIGLAISPVKPSRIWALIENEPLGGVYRSDDGGATWQYLSDDRNVRQRAWYFSKLFASPTDSNTVYAPNVSALASRDGGKTFGRGYGGGSDNHDMWLAPDGKRMIVGWDNGAAITTDGGTTSKGVNIPTGQWYHVHLTNSTPYAVCGAKQDAGASCGPVREVAAGRGGGAGGGPGGGGAAAPSAIGNAIANPFATFYRIGSGESGFVASSPIDPAITYAGEYSGVVEKHNQNTGTTVRVDPWPLNPMGHDAADSKRRIQWTFPIMNSPHNPHVVYVGSNVLFKSVDDGESWSVISPDLTRHDPATLGPSGGPITKDQTSVEYYATIFAIQESPITAGLIWTGSDDGLIYVTRNGGVTWKNVTPPGMASWTRIANVDPSPHNPGTVYVAANRYQMDDFSPYLYKTTDYGVTWTRINSGIPNNEFTRTIREDLIRPGLLYASTERSMYISYDAGKSWQTLKRNLPPTPVHDIALRDDDIVLATHGRGFWVMEGIGHLRDAPEAAAAAAGGTNFLYHPSAAYRAAGSALIEYVLAKANDSVTVEVTDRSGKLFKRFAFNDTTPAAGRGGGGGRGGAGGATKPPGAAGLNRFSIDLRYPNASSNQGLQMWQGSTSGPVAAPGVYTVRVKVGAAAPMTTTLIVHHALTTDATDQEISDLVAFSLKVRDRVSQANDDVGTLRSIRRQLNDRMPAMARNAAFTALGKRLLDSVNSVEDSMYQTKNKASEDPLNFPIRLHNQFGALLGFVNATERRLPKQAVEVYAVLAPLMDVQVARFKRITDVLVPQVNTQLKAAGQSPIVPANDPPPAGTGRGGRGG